MTGRCLCENEGRESERSSFGKAFLFACTVGNVIKFEWKMIRFIEKRDASTDRIGTAARSAKRTSVVRSTY